MPSQDHENEEQFVPDYMEYRKQLMYLAQRNLNPVLAKRFSPEDVVQETLALACRKTEYMQNCPEIPVYFKLRRLLFQTIKGIERDHLFRKKRDAYREQENMVSEDQSSPHLNWEHLEDTMTGPLTQIAQQDRYELLSRAIKSLPDHERDILELRHFDGLSNSECAEVLQLTQKNASIRYVRALKHLKSQLIEFSEFRP